MSNELDHQERGKPRGRYPKSLKTLKPKTMTGAEAGLGENVYTCTEMKTGDKYTRTTEAIIIYVQKKIEHVWVRVADSIRKMSKIDLKTLEPQKPLALNDKGVLVPKVLSLFEDRKLSQELRYYSTFKRQYESGLEKAFGIILGQCTPGMMSKLEQRSDWDTIQNQHCPIALLTAIKEICHRSQDHEYEIKTFARTLRYLECQEGETEGMNSYTKRFKNAADLVQAQCGGTPIQIRNYANKHGIQPSEAYNRLLAYLYVENSSSRKSGEVLKALDNDYAAAPKGKGDQTFPKDITEAVTRVTTY
jgi:hypothetical protein